MKKDEVKKAIRKTYGQIAKTSDACCGASQVTSCGCGAQPDGISKVVGYSDRELASLPQGADLGLGCGNPVALASLGKGQTVLDLGSGAGIDCFLAAKKVGAKGRVIGVDMTAGMLEKARANAKKAGLRNVEFRLGEIENLPVADNSVDVVISNCVINLCTDKKRVFKEVFRALRPGGRMMVSDIVLKAPLPAIVRDSVEAYVSCIAGAALKKTYLGAIRAAGFEHIRVLGETVYPLDLSGDQLGTAIVDLPVGVDELRRIASTILSIKVEAVKRR